METIMKTMLILLQEAIETQRNEQNILFLGVNFIKI